MTLADDFADDPARFLGRRFPDAKETIEARIRGIDSLDTIQEWVECEAAIGPRQEIIAALNQRKAELSGGPRGKSESGVSA